MVPRLAIASSRLMPMPLSRDGHRGSGGVRIDADREFRVLREQLRLRDRSETQPVAGIGGVGDQLTQEDLPVAVERVDHELQELTHFGLEAVGLARARAGGALEGFFSHGSLKSCGLPGKGLARISDLGNPRAIFKRRVCRGALLGRPQPARLRSLGVREQECGRPAQQGRDEGGGAGECLRDRPGRQVATGAQDIVQFIPQLQK